MNWDQLNEIIQRHGGALSEPVIVDPEIDNPDPVDRKLTPKIPNPNPTYRYNLKDGKYFTARGSQPGAGTGQGDEQTTFQVVDPGTAVQPLTPADRLPSAAQDLVKLDARGNVIPAGDTTTPVSKLRDPSTGAVTDLPDPKTNPEGTLKEFGNQLLNIKPDGSYTVIVSKPADAATQQAKSLKDAPDGSVWEYDPNKPEGQRLTKAFDAPTKDKPAPTTTVVNGTTYERDPATNTWNQAAGLPSETKPVAVSTNTQAPYLTSIDAQGNVVGKAPNPNYVAPTPTQLTPDLVAENIPLLKPDGTVQWVPNQNRVPASQAMNDLLEQANVRVNGKQLSMADAKDLLTGAVQTMNAQTAQQQNQVTAAGDILSNTRGNAQTAAGLLQQRVQAATGTLQSILGNTLGNKNITSYAPDTAANLVQGLSGWSASLMGGQSTMDSAARMIQMADPRSDMADPTTQAAISTLTQMLDKHQELTGGLHPADAQIRSATQAAQQSQQNGGVVAPMTPNPAYAATGAGAVASGYGASAGNPWGNAPNGFPAPVTSASGYNPAYASGGAGAVGAGFTAPSSGSGHTIIINA